MAFRSSTPSRSHSRRDTAVPFGSRTSIGCIRSHNEDSLVVMPPLFAVADGMGGHEAGEVASEIAVNVLSELAPTKPDAETLSHAVEEANREVFRASRDGRGREGMGTTLTAAMLENERLLIAQVGDSRAYLLHKGKLQQITRDHSLMADMIEAGQITAEEARTHPQRSIITRALGSNTDLHPDIYEVNVETGDRLLVCSDGLSTMVEDLDIERLLSQGNDPQRCASQLVNEAISNGGHDNITVIVADVTGFAEVRHKKMALKTKLSVAFILTLLVAIIIGCVWTANTYFNTVAYLINDNGKVALYRGVPGEVLGYSFSTFEYTTDINVDDLQPGTADNLERGIQVDNVAAAEALIEEYQKQVDQSSAPDEENASETQDSSNTTPSTTTETTEGTSGTSASEGDSSS